MSLPLKQFVPSAVCLQCDGCCRFQLADSAWRPKVGEQEILEEMDAAGYLKTIPVDDHHHCVFFNKSDHTCSVYERRPFECALYPFVLSKTPQGIKLCVHLACPYVQETETKQEFQDYQAYLKTFFKQPHTKDFLKNNSRLLHDYSKFDQELKFLFDIGEL